MVVGGWGRGGCKGASCQDNLTHRMRKAMGKRACCVYVGGWDGGGAACILSESLLAR